MVKIVLDSVGAVSFLLLSVADGGREKSEPFNGKQAGSSVIQSGIGSSQQYIGGSSSFIRVSLA